MCASCMEMGQSRFSSWWVLFLVALEFSVVNACTKEELVMVQMISRHGSISPVVLYPKDPNPDSVWKEGLGDLTMLGKFQSYALGCFLRALYEDFITSDPTELEVSSSALPHCVKSAQSLVTALYAPSPYWEIVQNFSWQPIFIKYDKEEEDMYLSKPKCLAAEKEHERLIARETYPILQTYKDLIYFWQLNSGWDLQSIVDIELLHDILETEVAYNLTVPDWAKTSWNEMKLLHDLSFVWRHKTRLLQRLRGGPLLNLTVERMKKRIADDKDQKKVAVYSTHGSNIAAYLSALGVWNYKKPTAGSTILIELYKHEGEPFVRYLYLNSTTPEREPQVFYSMTIPGCSEFCPLDYIQEYTRDIVPKNWAAECQIL